MRVMDAGAALEAVRPADAVEAGDLARLRAVASSASPWARDAALHLTASAVVVHPPSRRVLLRWLHHELTGLAKHRSLVEAAPPHSLPAIAQFARYFGVAWQRFADDLDQRARGLGA